MQMDRILSAGVVSLPTVRAMQQHMALRQAGKLVEVMNAFHGAAQHQETAQGLPLVDLPGDENGQKTEQNGLRSDSQSTNHYSHSHSLPVPQTLPQDESGATGTLQEGGSLLTQNVADTALAETAAQVAAVQAVVEAVRAAERHGMPTAEVPSPSDFDIVPNLPSPTILERLSSSISGLFTPERDQVEDQALGAVRV